MISGDGFNNIIKGRYGYLIYNKNDLFIGRALAKYGEFSEFEVKLFRQICKPGFHVMDVGANIGAHTLVMSQLVGNSGIVYAFEPQAIVFQTLCGNMAINSVENAACYQYVVSDEDGHVNLPRFNYNVEGNFGGIRAEDYSEGDSVTRVTLDSFIDCPRLDFIKIDVEGMEINVLSGGAKLIEKFQPVLYVENDQVDKSPYLLMQLQSMGYRTFWHLPPLYNPDNFYQDKENIYEGIVSVNMMCIPPRLKNANMNGFREALDFNFHPIGDSE